MPDNIETPFRELDLHLLPYNARDMRCECSCPDYTNPCKHVAGLCYLLVQQLDHDPFLLFELRGISREQLFGQLRQTPLGEILVSALAEEPSLPEPAQSYYTHPELQGLPSEADPHAFWQGAKKPPTELPVAPIHSIPAVIIKKGGDYPRFWPHSASFIQIMEQVYGAIRKKAKQW